MKWKLQNESTTEQAVNYGVSVLASMRFCSALLTSASLWESNALVACGEVKSRDQCDRALVGPLAACLVQHRHGAVPQDGPSDGNALTLASCTRKPSI
jgi:hypothetical protein